LAEKAGDYPAVVFDGSLPIHEHQIYAYFRRPSGLFEHLKDRTKFLILTENVETFSDKLKNCRLEQFEDGLVKLLRVNCGGRQWKM
jgi:hypothetical protein